MKYYLTIAAMFKDEERYLHEWITFHLSRGVEHIYLYDNSSTDNSHAVIAPFTASGDVTLIDWPKPITEGSQTDAANDALMRAKLASRWLAFIDIDEFLFSPLEHLPTVLREYENEVGIEVNWVCYGSSRHISTPSRSVRESFLYRAPLSWQRNRQFKCIVQTEAATEKTPFDHLWKFSGDQRSVNEERKVLGKEHSFFFRFERWLHERAPRIHQKVSWKFPLRFNPYFRINRPVSVRRLRINHYIVRSAEEYAQKQARHGDHRKGAYSEEFFRYHDRNEVYDPIIAGLSNDS